MQKFELPDLQPQKRRKISPVTFLAIIIDTAIHDDVFQHHNFGKVVNRL